MGPCSISTISLWSINGTWPESVLASIISSGSRRFWCFSHLSMAPLIMCEELLYWVMGSGLLPENVHSWLGIHAIRRKSQPLTSLLERVFWTSFPLSKDRGRQARSLYHSSFYRNFMIESFIQALLPYHSQQTCDCKTMGNGLWFSEGSFENGSNLDPISQPPS